MAEIVSVEGVRSASGWQELTGSLGLLPECLADLRSPFADRMDRLADVLQQMEKAALAATLDLLALRDHLYPDPASWVAVPLRYPQPDPTLVLALREWVMSLGTEPSVPLQRQKRLNKSLTQILVARAALETYSEQLHDDRPDVLLRVLSAVWVLIAEIWKARPLMSSGGSGDDG